MNNEFRAALIGIADRVLGVSRTDGDLRSDLRVVAQGILSVTAEIESRDEPTVDEPGQPVAAPVESLSMVGVAEERPAVGPTLPSTDLEDDDLPASGGGSGSGLGQDIDVPALIERLWFKAEAARWAAERQRLQKAGFTSSDVAPTDQGFVTSAKAEKCYLWMLDFRWGHTTDSDGFDLIAGNYETVAEAVALAECCLSKKQAQPHEVVEALSLLAEAQSAVRVAVSESGGYSDDDQQRLFRAVRELAAERGIYIPKGLKSNDPVAPSEWAAIAGRVHAVRQQFEERDRAERQRAKLLKNLAHKASEISATGDEPDAWKGLVPVIEELVRSGVQPSRIEIREALLPIADRLPHQSEVPKAFGLVLREIERFQAQAVPSRTAQNSEPPTEDVQKVAELLAGKALVLIGAQGRRSATTAIEKEFGLIRVDWIVTSEHESYRNFEPYIARPDVAAVLLLVRWANHSFSEVKTVCDRHGKPLVRLPRGYSPNQIAAEILSQASDRLGQQQGGQ